MLKAELLIKKDILQSSFIDLMIYRICWTRLGNVPMHLSMCSE